MKRIIFCCVAIFLVIVSIVLFNHFSQPSKVRFSEEFKTKAVERILGRKAMLTDSTPKGDKIYDGNLITFSYPAKAVTYEYREQSSSKDESGLDDFSFDIKNPKLVFNLKVYDSGGTLSLTDFPAVKLRIERSYEYDKSTPRIDGVEGIAFAKSEGLSEKSGFFLYDSKIITLSVTGGDYDEVSNLFDAIVSSSKLK